MTDSHPKQQELTGNFAYPFEDLTEQQQTHRLDEVLGWPNDFGYVAIRDSYRRHGSVPESADYCPAAAVEERRKWLDRVTGA